MEKHTEEIYKHSLSQIKKRKYLKMIRSIYFQSCFFSYAFYCMYIFFSLKKNSQYSPYWLVT